MAPSISRRKFLYNAGATAASASLNSAMISGTGNTSIRLLDPDKMIRYVDPLPIPPIARASRMLPDPATPGRSLPYFRMAMQQIRQKVHRDLPPTVMWGIGPTSPGPTFETRSGQGVLVEWVNELPIQHLLPIDHTLHGAEKSNLDVRTVIHLHGGKTPPESDGYPEEWFTHGGSRLCHYPNQQDPCLLFYHDHTMGINRLNIYAGLQGLFIIRDDFEDQLNLPKGKYEVPLLIYDRNLTEEGQLSYPTSGNPHAPWVPEVYGNCVLVNGKLFPYLQVEPRRYRFRIVNGANARFYRFVFGENFELYQIGSDQGLLSSPVALKSIVLAPGERADVIFDFSGYAGQPIPLCSAGSEIMQFRVGRVPLRDESSLPQMLRPVSRVPEKCAVRTRLLTLDEKIMAKPNMDPLLHSDERFQSMGMLLNGTPWHMPVTEKPILNTTEIWELVNLTEDIHPIHLHMVKFQLLDRRLFDVGQFKETRNLRFTGPVMSAPAEESGWKDTIRVPPGEITRIIVPFKGFTGRYVWHCHILEHEDNDMMRPYEVMCAAWPDRLPGQAARG